MRRRRSLACVIQITYLNNDEIFFQKILLVHQVFFAKRKQFVEKNGASECCNVVLDPSVCDGCCGVGGLAAFSGVNWDKK